MNDDELDALIEEGATRNSSSSITVSNSRSNIGIKPGATARDLQAQTKTNAITKINAMLDPQQLKGALTKQQQVDIRREMQQEKALKIMLKTTPDSERKQASAIKSTNGKLSEIIQPNQFIFKHVENKLSNEESKQRSEPRTKTMTSITFKKTEETNSGQEKTEQNIMHHNTLPGVKVSTQDPSKNSKLATMEFPSKQDHELQMNNPQNSKITSKYNNELANSTKKPEAEIIEKVEKHKQTDSKEGVFMGKLEVSNQLAETTIEKHNTLVVKTSNEKADVKGIGIVEEQSLSAELPEIKPKTTPTKLKEQQPIDENNSRIYSNEMKDSQIPEKDEQSLNNFQLSEKKTRPQDFNETKNVSESEKNSLSSKETLEVVEKLADTAAQRISESSIKNDSKNLENDETAAKLSSYQKEKESRDDTGGSGNTQDSAKSLQAKLEAPKENPAKITGFLSDFSQISDRTSVNFSQLTHFAEQKTDFSHTSPVISSNQLDESMIKFTESMDKSFYLSEETLLKLNETSLKVDMSRRSVFKLKTSLKHFIQKLDNKNPKFITYIDEQTQTEKKLELTQNLIRKAKTVSALKSAELEEERANFLLLKDQTFNSSVLHIAPFDPLDSFDDEEKEVFSSFRKERSFRKLPVTNNPLIGRYQIQITEKKLLFDISRTFYPELDPIFHSLVNLDFGIPSCALVVSGQYLIIGTSYGQICIFDLQQKLVCKLGTAKGKAFGAVTCLDFSSEVNLIVAGYMSGATAVWDLKDRKQLKYMTDHKVPVLSVKIWKSNPLNFISSDVLGNIITTKVTKITLLYQAKSNVLFTKSAGCATSIDILNNNPWCSQVLGEEILKQTFTAIGSNIAVMICCIHPGMEVLYKFLRPSNVIVDSIPSVSWGRSNYRSKENEKPKVYLVVAWGTYIYLLELVEKGDRVVFPLVAHLQLEFEINYCGWIGENIIFAIDSKSLLHIVHTSEFQQSNVSLNVESQLDEERHSNNQGESKKEGSAQNVAGTPSIKYIASAQDIEFLSQSFLKDMQNGTKESYQNSISSNNNDILIIGKKSVHMIKVLSWRDYLLKLLEGNQFFVFLSVTVEISRSNIKEFSEISTNLEERRRIILEGIEEKLMDYIEKKLFYEIDEKGVQRMIEDENYKIDALISLIDFYLEFEDYELLFIKLKKIVASLGMNEVFLECLEPFIKLNKIKFIPDQVLREVVYFYVDQEKHKLMQHLILNLDVKRLDILALQTLCLEFNLNAALIYIVMEQEEVVMPFVKLINDYMKGKTGAKSLEEVRKSGYQCLWLLKMCFKGRLCFSTKNLPDAKWRSILENIIAAVFEKEYLRLLFEIEPTVTINLLLLLFTGEAARIVDELSENFREMHEAFDPNEHADIHENLFMKIYEVLTKGFTGDQEKRMKSYLGFFVTQVIRSEKYYFIDKGLTIAYANYFLRNSSELTNDLLIMNFKMNLPNSRSDGGPINFVEELNQHFSSEFAESEKNELILSLIKYSEPKGEDLKGCIRLSQLSPLIEVTSYLYNLEKQYKRAFEIFLPSTVSKSTKLEVFKHLTEYLSNVRLKDSQSFKEFKSYVLDRMRDLVIISCEETKKLIDKFFKSEEEVFVWSLAGEPNMQLEYLEKMLEGRQPGDFIENKLLVLHIELLCRSKEKTSDQGRKFEKKILQALKNNDYPQDDCLELCRKYNLKGPQAYLERKRGGSSGIEQAIKLQFEIFEQYVHKCIEKKNQITQKHAEKLKEPLNICIEIFRENDDGASEKQNTWLELFDKISLFQGTLEVSYHANFKADIVSNSLDDILEELLSYMLKSYSIDIILDQIRSKSHQYNLKKIKVFLVKILENKKHLYNIFKITKALMIDDFIDNGIALGIDAPKALGVGSYANTTPEEMNQIMKTSVLGCGHMQYYPNSEELKNCAICQQDLISQILNVLTLPKGLPTRKASNIPKASMENKKPGNFQVSENDTQKMKVYQKKRILKHWDQKKGEETIQLFHCFGNYYDYY